MKTLLTREEVAANPGLTMALDYFRKKYGPEIFPDIQDFHRVGGVSVPVLADRRRETTILSSVTGIDREVRESTTDEPGRRLDSRGAQPFPEIKEADPESEPTRQKEQI